MNKLSKLGVSALCGSLAAISAANAGDLTVTGGADMTWVSASDTVNGNPLGIGSNFGLKGSGELENGWTVGLSIAHTNAGAFSTTNVDIGVPGLGSIKVAQGVSGTGIQRLDDITPTVWEEADGAGISAGINKIAGTSAGGTIEVSGLEAMPDGLDVKFAYSPDADGGSAADKGTGGSSGVLGSGWDLTASASSDLHGVDGLTVYAGMSEVSQQVNAATYSGDVEETVYGIGYAIGSFNAGYQVTKEDTGQTAVTEYKNTSYGITFSVNDDLSIGYGHVESDSSGGAANPEADAYQIAYTMGGASIRIAEVDVSNATYSTASSGDKSGTVISLGLAF